MKRLMACRSGGRPWLLRAGTAGVALLILLACVLGIEGFFQLNDRWQWLPPRPVPRPSVEPRPEAGLAGLQLDTLRELAPYPAPSDFYEPAAYESAFDLQACGGGFPDVRP
jgi:hypothetical protein